MPAYTTVLQKPLEAISWEDDHFIEELLEVVQLFRPFSTAITGFILEHGYDGDPDDVVAKVNYIRTAFLKADMDAPREVREWFTKQQPIRRDTAFQICFAFGLDGSETDEFFRRVYARERSFNCHRVQEAIYYFCLNNGLTWADAMDIQSRVPLAGSEKAEGEAVRTGSIIAELNQLETKEELITWLNENLDKFTVSNVTAYENIRRLWKLTSGPDGLLIRERKVPTLPSILDDAATGQRKEIRSGTDGVRIYDAYLAILQLDKDDIDRLHEDRSIRPLLGKLHGDAQNAFPDRQGIDRILRGKVVSYERVRKWLVLLTFYTWWARKAIERGHYRADPGDADRCITSMNHYLADSGYPELYVGNPYDWIFLYAAKQEEPLFVFRYIWNELLTDALEEHR